LPRYKVPAAISFVPALKVAATSFCAVKDEPNVGAKG